MLLLILFLPSSENGLAKPYRIVSIVFVTGNTILTNVTYFVNIAICIELLVIEKI
ncbi:hypothetical protein [Clostridium intestinale]|uniref:hypothetical protein n=1 Tax=Clostridium intestinale TaxID=36845 RepID=UPI00158770A8|nr:hypothetical protein [Clostridium intestinale]